MEVGDSRVLMAARSTRLEVVQQRERLEAWRVAPDATGRDAALPATPGRAETAPGQRVSAIARDAAPGARISAQARALQPARVVAPESEAGQLSAEAELEFSLLKALIERLTGREIRLFRPGDVAPVADPPQPEGIAGDAATATPSWGLAYDSYESRLQVETLSFAASGTIVTRDGARIDFEVSLSVERRVFTETRTSVRAGAALTDPIVLNFSGSAAELTRERFAFDLDFDGRTEQIAFVGPDSAFLALDRNGDGKVNDGRELFGPATGDGFSELAALDNDGNGWLDAADPVFSRLRLWSRDGAGEERLVALGDRGVGAIYLGHVATPMTMDAGSSVGGALRDTGIYVDESGRAGTVQQIDLVS